MVGLELAQRLSPAERDRAPIEPLLEHALRQLQAELAIPEREESDWRIRIGRACSCDDCDALHAFLASSQTTAALPLNKNRRQHLHQVIDGGTHLVRHVTRRKGSPYTLVLDKTTELFATERRNRQERRKTYEVMKRALGRD